MTAISTSQNAQNSSVDSILEISQVDLNRLPSALECLSDALATSPSLQSIWRRLDSNLGTNLLGLAVVIIRGDIVWCVADTWVAVSIC